VQLILTTQQAEGSPPQLTEKLLYNMHVTPTYKKIKKLHQQHIYAAAPTVLIGWPYSLKLKIAESRKKTITLQSNQNQNIT